MLLAVNGTLMRGLELNNNLVRVGATFVREAKTASCYRVWSVNDRYPGMLRVTRGGSSVSCEVWDISPEGLADVLNREPAGLTVGRVMLDDGTEVFGVLAEPWAVEGMREITAFGGWRKYTATLTSRE
jgi:gamma-glutamylcyclotransferase (GGCT)/AIG2-like uncharacterized protein YtfP